MDYTCIECFFKFIEYLDADKDQIFSEEVKFNENIYDQDKFDSLGASVEL